MHPSDPSDHGPAAIEIFTIPMAAGPVEAERALFDALATAERFFQDAIQLARPNVTFNRRVAALPSVRRSSAHSSVVVIGAGIVNLVTSHALIKQGFDVTVADASPDPRLRRDWRQYGCSRGGGNARMFSFTEADDYHDRNPDASPDSNNLFDKPPARLGWDIRPGTADLDSDRQWVQEFKRVPAWLARAYTSDILGLNRRSGELWQSWIKSQPGLFGDVCLRHDVLRLYEHDADLAAGAQRQADVGALLKRYRPREVRELFPALRDAEPGAFAGGVLIRGFTLSVHDFMARLLDGLERAGVRLRFEQRVEELLRDKRGRVTGVLTASGPITGDHYVASPGAYGDALLRGTCLAGLIHGVLGCWVTVPNCAPRLENSLKVARHGHVANDANVTVGRDESGRPALIIGSGYGWTGADPANIDETKLLDIRIALVDTVRRLFPNALEVAGGEPVIRKTSQVCVRPWTSSNLGLFHTDRTENGLFIFTGGHNTGGFAQAPVVAEAVLAALNARRHPMHTIYAPHRTDLALG